ncbi:MULTISPECIES: hypothetical protein [Myxococcus]|uniref:hypothetical protein n=1 Tax=Myxococcus TaxID=32 RepID=UPI0011438002|nr:MULTISPECIES: hypothetical protein [Myxococcus]NOK01759.1 hypothetical protein [Myxococcus xanthus]
MNRRMKATLAVVAPLLLTDCSGTSGDDGDACVQVRVFARPASGDAECRSFATPCDVPRGYVECCGGFHGDCVSTGTRCVDDPLDACSPGSGAKDCPGICQ